MKDTMVSYASLLFHLSMSPRRVTHLIGSGTGAEGAGSDAMLARRPDSTALRVGHRFCRSLARSTLPMGKSRGKTRWLTVEQKAEQDRQVTRGAAAQAGAVEGASLPG
jgi:hypothetical protein